MFVITVFALPLIGDKMITDSVSPPEKRPLTKSSRFGTKNAVVLDVTKSILLTTNHLLQTARSKLVLGTSQREFN